MCAIFYFNDFSYFFNKFIFDERKGMTNLDLAYILQCYFFSNY